MTDADKWRAFMTYIAPDPRPLKINDGSALRNRIRWIVAVALAVAILTGGAVALRDCHRNMQIKGEVK